ncbi:MAG: peptide ABC transporter substrate-binding protein [Gemmatimonadaceae bacterium]
MPSPHRPRPRRRSRQRHRLAIIGGALTAAALAGCGPSGADSPDDGGPGGAAAANVGGTLVIAVPTGPSTLMPPTVGGIQAKQITDLVYERLAEIGPGLNTFGEDGFEPRLATSWTWSADSTAISFHLDPRARWHDGRPVRATDVRYTFAVNRDSTQSVDAGYLRHVDSVTTPDSLTATVWFAHHYPEQFYDAAGRLSILPEHLLGDVPAGGLDRSPQATAPVGSGPFRFVRLQPGALIELAADTGYHLGRPALDRVIMSVAPNPVAAATQLFNGEADVYEAIMPQQMGEFASHPDVVARITPSLTYSFLQFNLRDPRRADRPHPLLADRELRRALSMLVDREALVASVWDSLAVVGLGPFPRALPTADTTVRQLAHDPARAAAILDSLGWRDGDGDGVRERAGRPLAISVTVPTSSAFRQRMAVLLQDQLARGGVRLTVERLEFNTFLERLRARRFDTNLGSWVLTDGSPAGMRATWGSDGAQNHGRYASAAADAQVDSGLASFDVTERRAHFGRAYQMMVDDAPAVWLYEPRNVIGVHRRFVTPPIRAAGWWLDVPEWSVRAGERIARDGGVLAAAAAP